MGILRFFMEPSGFLMDSFMETGLFFTAISC